MKPDRQAIIREIISTRAIETQNQLMEALLERGIRSTQATVSRDIREMRLVKDQGADGRYHYQLPNKETIPEVDVKLRKIFRESITSYDVAQNIVVLKTLAGDDTAFLAMSDKDSAVEFCSFIEELLK